MKSHPSFIHPPPIASMRSVPSIPAMPSPVPNMNAPSPKPRLRYPTNSDSSTIAPTPIAARNTLASSKIFFLVSHFASAHCPKKLKNSSAYGIVPKKCVMWSHCIGNGDV